MPCIAVVDDGDDMRKTVVRMVKQQLNMQKKNDTWEVIDTEPLPRIEDYDSWINENEVSVLILDERLHEKAEDAVDYAGHEVARHLRERFPDLPQFIITSIDNPDDLDANGGDLEAVLSRTTFNKAAATYVQRMLRIGQSFYDENEGKLSRLAQLSEKLVLEHLSEDEDAELRALRQSFILNAAPTGLDETLERADEILAELRAVAGEMKGLKGGKSP